MCLLYFSTIIANNNSQRKCLLLMQYPPSAQTAISIPKTIESLPSTVVSSVLAAHVLSGCDKVPQLFGIGNKKVIKLLKGQDNNANGIEQLGNIDPDIPWDNTERGCISFIYLWAVWKQWQQNAGQDALLKWVEKSKSNTMTSVKDLEKFTPTVEAARLNIKRVHYQASIWT